MKLVTLTCREFIGIFAMFLVDHWYCTFCLFMPKLSLLLTDVSTGTPPSLSVHDVIEM